MKTIVHDHLTLLGDGVETLMENVRIAGDQVGRFKFLYETLQ